MLDRDAEATHVAVGALYDAAYGAAVWSDALDRLTGLYHGSRSWLFRFGPDGVDGHSSLLDEEFHGRAGKEAIMRDPAFSLTSAQRPGTIVTHDEIYDAAAFRRRELWQDWMRPRDLYFGLQFYLNSSGGSSFFIDIDRAEGQGDFSDEDKALMRLIAPHLERAGEISKALSSQSFGTGHLATSRAATIVVDRAMQVVELNQAAASILDKSAALDVIGGRLHARRSLAFERLQALVLDCTAHRWSKGGVMLMSPDEGAGGSNQLVVSVAPLRSAEIFGLPGDPLAAIFLRTAHGDQSSDLNDVFASLFRLTPAQARLARALAKGVSLRQAAAERGLTYASARTYLEQIFRKTGTRRQPELVALLKTVEISTLSG